MMEQKEETSIKAHPTSIKKLKTDRSFYYLSVKGPEETGRKYNNTAKLSAQGIGSIVGAFSDSIGNDVMGKPASISLVGKNVMAFYNMDNNKLMAVKPHVLYLRPKTK